MHSTCFLLINNTNRTCNHEELLAISIKKRNGFLKLIKLHENIRCRDARSYYLFRAEIRLNKCRYLLASFVSETAKKLILQSEDNRCVESRVCIENEFI